MVSFLLLFCPSSYGLSKSSQNKMDLSKIIGIIFDAALVIWASALLASWTLWIGLRAIVSYGTCILFSISCFSVQKKKKLENWSRVACIPDQDSVAASNQNQLWKPPWLEPNNFGRNKKKNFNSKPAKDWEKAKNKWYPGSNCSWKLWFLLN